MSRPSLSRFKLAVPIVCVLALPLIFILVCLLIYHFGKLGLPKDGDLIALFRANHQGFDRLRTMATEDAGAVAIISKGNIRRTKLSESRREEYLHWLAISRNMTIGIGPLIPDGNITTGAIQYEVNFIFARGGLLLSIGPAWMKGIVYLPDGYEKFGTTVTNLDKAPAKNGTYLVPIERNWYVIYQERS
jgi:hypothetical protein